MNWDTLWYWWHINICHRTQFKYWKRFERPRRQWYWRTLHALQLPICKWLDNKAHK